LAIRTILLEIQIMKKNISIDRVTVLAIAMPMIVLLFVGHLSYVNITKFIQETPLPTELNNTKGRTCGLHSI